MKIKKRHLKNLFYIIIIVFTAIFSYKWFQKDPYKYNNDTIFYSSQRPNPDYELILDSRNESLTIYKLNFKSRDFLEYKTRIYGLLFIPNSTVDVPGLILLPGGGVKKEDEANVASIIASMGYAVLTFDQRGIGQTGGLYLFGEQDYAYFAQGKEPIQHLSVYDALAAFDVMQKVKGIDKNNIAIAGESMGGRYAVIAAAIEKRFKGLIIISSSGFHIKKDSSNPYFSYLISIDPDHYIDMISPRNIVMLHGTNDSTIPIESAKKTFDMAKYPKTFFIAEGCGHGFCTNMINEINTSLNIIFDR